MCTAQASKCDLCGRSYQGGPGVYTGRTISAYKLSVCNGCLSSSQKGWAPEMEPLFVAHLVKAHIPLPNRNTHGLYPRGE